MISNGGTFEDGSTFEPLKTLPGMNTWSEDWGNEKKLFTNFKFKKGETYYLFTRKPYWYIFKSTTVMLEESGEAAANNVQVNDMNTGTSNLTGFANATHNWNDWWTTIYGIHSSIYKNSRGRTAWDVSSFPNLTSKVVDGLQGRHFQEFNWESVDAKSKVQNIKLPEKYIPRSYEEIREEKQRRQQAIDNAKYSGVIRGQGGRMY